MSTADLRAVSCRTARKVTSCQAVGTGGPHGEAAVVPITDGRANAPQYIESSGPLYAVACVEERTCLAAGETSGHTGGLSRSRRAACRRWLGRTSCGGSRVAPRERRAKWWARPPVSRKTHEAPVARIAKPSLNENNQACNLPPVPSQSEYDGVVDNFAAEVSGVQANIGRAPSCRDNEPSYYPTSSWVMLLAGSPEDFVQGGIFYNPNGTDEPFVEVECRNPHPGCGTQSVSDPYIEVPPGDGSIEIKALDRWNRGSSPCLCTSAIRPE